VFQSQKSEDLEKLISSLTFPQLVFKESNVLSKIETIGSVSIETSPSDMNYQSPKALQAQTKNRAIKPAHFLSGNVTIASSLLGTTTIPHVFPSKPISFSCLPSSDKKGKHGE
jgi:hypothetical protein